jgi:hypothetical protein
MNKNINRGLRYIIKNILIRDINQKLIKIVDSRY